MERSTKIEFLRGVINGTIDPKNVDKATLLPKDKTFDSFTNAELEEYIHLIELYQGGQVLTELQEMKLLYYTEKYDKQSEQDKDNEKVYKRLTY